MRIDLGFQEDAVRIKYVFFKPSKLRPIKSKKHFFRMQGFFENILNEVSFILSKKSMLAKIIYKNNSSIK